MKMKWLFPLAAGAGAVLISGCVSTVDGRHEMGVPFVKDRVEYNYERPVLEVWAAAKDVLAYNGTIIHDDRMHSTLEANVDTRTVRVKVESADAKTTKVTVQVRTKTGGTDQALAGEIDKEIAIRLATGNLTPATKGK